MKEVLQANIRSFLLTVLILGSSALQALAHYHPDEGRWLSRDPIEEEGGLGLYVFAGNDSANRWDALGMWPTGAYGYGGRVHQHLTADAWSQVVKPLEMAPFNARISAILQIENVDVDERPRFYENYWHFNRGLSEASSVAIAAYTEILRREWLKMLSELEHPNPVSCRLALTYVGGLSHSWQDYYAHAIDSRSNGGIGTVGRITGNPDYPGTNMKPASWGSRMPFRWGEHGRYEPAYRAPDVEDRLNFAMLFTARKLRIFTDLWWPACKCHARDAVE